MSTQNKVSRKLRLPDKHTFSYGSCQQCSSAIVIPGLEAYLCDRFGWVARKFKRIRDSPEPTEIISFVPEPEPTVLDLVEEVKA